MSQPSTVYARGRARLSGVRDPLDPNGPEQEALRRQLSNSRPSSTSNSGGSGTIVGQDETPSYSKAESGRASREKPRLSPVSSKGDDGQYAERSKGRAVAGSDIGGEGDDRPWHLRSTVYQFMPFRGIYHDIRRRLPYYISDWTVAFHPKNIYRVFACSIRLYFINLMPAISYILDMNRRTGGFYGLNEVVLSSAIPLLVLPLFAVQPLTISGVTGLTNLFNYTTYDICQRHGVNYAPFQGWMLVWAAIFHFLAAIFNLCDYTRFITDMTSATFGFYVGIIYIQKGVELIIDEFGVGIIDGWLSTLVAVLFTICVYWVEKAGGQPFGPFWFRKLIGDYAFPLGLVFFSGFVHIPGNLASATLRKLPVTKAFEPSTDRDWVINFWGTLEVKWIFVAMPFGILVTMLFYFDHNVSSLMAQAKHYPVRRPAGFHWDFFLLGCTTLVAGILGLPAVNGLVPQCPIHTDGLAVQKVVRVSGDEEAAEKEEARAMGTSTYKVAVTRLVEQRLDHFAVGLLTIGTMTRPLLVALGTMPRAVFAGVFLLVGWASVEGNPIVHRTLYLFRDQRMTPPDHPLRSVRRRKILIFVAVQWFVAASTIAISQTIAAIGFPVIFIAMIPFRYFVLPRWLSKAELEVLDSPTASANCVFVSIGGDPKRDPNPVL